MRDVKLGILAFFVVLAGCSKQNALPTGGMGGADEAGSLSLHTEIAAIAREQNSDPLYALTADDIALLESEQAASPTDLVTLQPLVQGTTN